MRNASMRYCPHCKGTAYYSAGSEVLVVPYYESHIRSVIDRARGLDIPELYITEKYICPRCGKTVSEEYKVDLTQADMQQLVDNIFNSKQ